MSTTATMSGNAGLARTSVEADHSLPEAGRPSLWGQFKSQFYRFLERLPEGHSGVDVDALRRFPVPF